MQVKFISQTTEAVQFHSAQMATELVLLPSEETVVETCVGATWTAKSLLNLSENVRAWGGASGGESWCDIVTVEVEASRMPIQPWEAFLSSAGSRREHACYAIG